MEPLCFLVPLESKESTIGALVERAWWEATSSQVRALFDGSAVTVQNRITKNLHRAARPGDRVVCEVGHGERESQSVLPIALVRGSGWVVVDKPVGMSGLLDPEDANAAIWTLADELGQDRHKFSPVWRAPIDFGGPWLFATDSDGLRDLSERGRIGQLKTTWTALVCPVPRGSTTFDCESVRIQWGLIRMIHGCAEIQLTPDFRGDEALDPVAFLRQRLSERGFPILGDRHHGGAMVPGGLRLRLVVAIDSPMGLEHSWSVPETGWLPDGPVLPESSLKPAPRLNRDAWAVSQKTWKALVDGQAWLMRDEVDPDAQKLDPGTLIQVVDPSRRPGPFVLVDGPGPVAGRTWGMDTDSLADQIAYRLDVAMGNRADLFAELNQTDLFRLVHAEADQLPGFLLDRVGPLLRATLTTPACRLFADAIYESILDEDPEMMIAEVAHWQDMRRRTPSQVVVVHEGAGYVIPGSRVIGREDGLRYWVEPFRGLDTGFFSDQRDNRRRLRQFVKKGERWLNLFCHTGAFSVVLVSLGAEVVSVDISKRYLNWLEENLELNQIDVSQNRSTAVDARSYLDGGSQLFDGIIVDPPTSAAGPNGFWSIRKDFLNLLVSCFGRLSPEGTMLVCRNDRYRVPTLDDLINEAAQQTGWRIGELIDAPPSMDYPRRSGFPEGDSFEGRWVR